MDSQREKESYEKRQKDLYEMIGRCLSYFLLLNMLINLEENINGFSNLFQRK